MTDPTHQYSSAPVRLPRIKIEFCVKCKWNLRAAYFAQELLQTFSDTIGEIALVPVTGGIFTITVYHAETTTSSSGDQSDNVTKATAAEGSDNSVNGSTIKNPSATQQTIISTTIIWDRKRDGGFPETKELKNRVRNIIEPGKNMGHVDRALKKGTAAFAEKKEDGKGVEVGDEEKKTEQSQEQQPPLPKESRGTNVPAEGTTEDVSLKEYTGSNTRNGEDTAVSRIPPVEGKLQGIICEDCK